MSDDDPEPVCDDECKKELFGAKIALLVGIGASCGEASAGCRPKIVPGPHLNPPPTPTARRLRHLRGLLHPLAHEAVLPAADPRRHQRESPPHSLIHPPPSSPPSPPSPPVPLFPLIQVASALSAGIVFGAFLSHMIPDANSAFSTYLTDKYGGDPSKKWIVDYPWAQLCMGAVLVLLVAVDRLIVAHGMEGVPSGAGDHGNGGAEDSHAHSHDHISQAFLDIQAADAAKAKKDAEFARAVAPPRALGDNDDDDGDDAVGRARRASDESSVNSASELTGGGGGPTIRAPTAVVTDGRKGSASSASASAPASTKAGPVTPLMRGGSGRGAGGREGAKEGGGQQGGGGGGASAPSYGSVGATTPSRKGVARRAGASSRGAVYGAKSGEGSAQRYQDDDEEEGDDEEEAAGGREGHGHSHGGHSHGGGHGPLSSDDRTAAHAHREAILRAYVFFAAMSLHATFDGLSLGSETSLSGFYGVLAAVLSHKIFDGLALGIPVYLAEMGGCATWSALVFCALTTPLGIGIGMVAQSSVGDGEAKLVEGVVIALSAGSFLFISIVELLPAALNDGRLVQGKLLAFTLGWAAMALLAGYV
jgi:zinc transporter ZupT